MGSAAELGLLLTQEPDVASVSPGPCVNSRESEAALCITPPPLSPKRITLLLLPVRSTAHVRSATKLNILLIDVFFKLN